MKTILKEGVATGQLGVSDCTLDTLFRDYNKLPRCFETGFSLRNLSATHYKQERLLWISRRVRISRDLSLGFSTVALNKPQRVK